MVVHISELWMVRRFAEGPLPFAAAACDRASQMDLPLTLAICAGLLALAVFAGWRGARPPNPHRGPRLMPWRFIMLLASAGLLATLVHVVNLLGLTTGRN